MCITDEILWKAAKDVYRPDYNKLEKFIDKPTQAEGYYVDSTSDLSGNHASYESHGLQASLIKVNGQYVVAARGTANEDRILLPIMT
ncbi:MAG TPA: hypothetical protein H9869_05960 [Candidatus Ligilactobacillus excrementipullorum]|nr:hypothetical protein [Candidatus Ligilactobacillus excrementipullorum]